MSHMVCSLPIRWPIRIARSLVSVIIYSLMVLQTMSDYRLTDYQPLGKRP